MELSELNPYVRYSDKRITKLIYKENVMSYDFRLFYILKGQCNLIYGEKTYELRKNMQVIFPPCREYRFSTEEAVELIVLNFDLSFEMVGSYQMPPSKVDKYRIENAYIPDNNDIFDKIIIVDNAVENLDVIKNIVTVKNGSGEYKNELASALMKQVLINTIVMKKSRNNKITPLIKDMMKYINENYNTNITNMELGDMFNYHPSYINKRFYKETGTTIRKYLINKRLEMSREFLKSTNYSICDVGLLCGFDSAPYFAKYFKKTTGLSPKEYRKKYYML